MVSVFSKSRQSSSLTYFTDLYGTSNAKEEAVTNGHANGAVAISKKRTVVHLSYCDSIPAHGPISDMTFALAKNGVSIYDIFTFF